MAWKKYSAPACLLVGNWLALRDREQNPYLVVTRQPFGKYQKSKNTPWSTSHTGPLSPYLPPPMQATIFALKLNWHHDDLSCLACRKATHISDPLDLHNVMTTQPLRSEDFEGLIFDDLICVTFVQYLGTMQCTCPGLSDSDLRCAMMHARSSRTCR